MMVDAAYQALLAEDLDASEAPCHELDVLAEVLRHEVVAADVHALGSVDRCFDLLGRFAPAAPVPLALIDAVFLHDRDVPEELVWVPEMVLDILWAHDVVECHAPAFGLLLIPLHTAQWAPMWGARMRRDATYPGLPPDMLVRDWLIDCALTLLATAVREGDTLLVRDLLPHAAYWLHQHGSALTAQRLRRLVTAVRHARMHLGSKQQ